MRNPSTDNPSSEGAGRGFAANPCPAVWMGSMISIVPPQTSHPGSDLFIEHEDARLCAAAVIKDALRLGPDVRLDAATAECATAVPSLRTRSFAPGFFSNRPQVRCAEARTKGPYVQGAFGLLQRSAALIGPHIRSPAPRAGFSQVWRQPKEGRRTVPLIRSIPGAKGSGLQSASQIPYE